MCFFLWCKPNAVKTLHQKKSKKLSHIQVILKIFLPFVTKIRNLKIWSTEHFFSNKSEHSKYETFLMDASVMQLKSSFESYLYYFYNNVTISDENKYPQNLISEQCLSNMSEHSKYKVFL